jgi:hypothetical protein
MANEIIYELQPQTSWQPIVPSGVYHRANYRRNDMNEERRHNDEAIIAELRGLRALFDNKIDSLTATSGRIEVQTT